MKKLENTSVDDDTTMLSMDKNLTTNTYIDDMRDWIIKHTIEVKVL